ncbi:PH domain-containing protein [Hyphococcus sp.]|uniref:PH domain-containing protein n=1 Tax=Hyphococcus sp. TaxID=2038636 RepID=UPI0035C670C2
MPYVKETLAPGEEYLYRAHFNWTYDVQSWFWLAFSAIPAGMWVYSAARDYFAHNPYGHMFLFVAGAAFMLGLVICLRRYVHKWTTVIAVTSVRLILKTGMVARTSHEVMLDEIEEVLVEQTFLGRLLGYGTLKVRGTGAAVVEFPVVGGPMRVRREIETALITARGLAKQRA